MELATTILTNAANNIRPWGGFLLLCRKNRQLELSIQSVKKSSS